MSLYRSIKRECLHLGGRPGRTREGEGKITSQSAELQGEYSVLLTGYLSATSTSIVELSS